MKPKKRIKEIAARLKAIYGTCDPEEIITQRKIEIKYLDNETEKEFLKGAYVEECVATTIYINPNLNEYERRITLAHELGHSIFHGHLNAFELANNPLSVPGRYENEADLFAAELLLDDNVFGVYFGESFQYIAQCEEVPESLVDLKYNNLA